MAVKTIEWAEDEHATIDMDRIESLLTFLRQNHTKLKDEADASSFSDIIGYLETAKGMASDNKRMTCLYDAATKYVNQLAFRLYVEEGLDEETAKRFRDFDTVKSAAALARSYSEEDKAHADTISALQREYMADREDFDVFIAVIRGMSEEEAKAKQKAFRERQKQALEGQVQGA